MLTKQLSAQDHIWYRPMKACPGGIDLRHLQHVMKAVPPLHSEQDSHGNC